MTNELMYLLLALVGVIAGFMVAWLLSQGKARQLLYSNRQLATEVNDLKASQQQTHNELAMARAIAVKYETLNGQAQQQVTDFKLDMQERTNQLIKANEQIATLTAQQKHYREKLDNQQNDMLRMREQARLEFSEMAQKILEENSKKYATQNEQSIKQLLDPLRTNITEFKQKVEDTYDKESKERFTLAREVQRLIEMSATVSAEANNLASALKSNTKTQGNWGEMLLESLLEHSGLTKGREYQVQEFIRDESGNIVKDENGRSLQPDVTIYYPDERKVIIDSKVSLIAWERYVSGNEVAKQQTDLTDHIRSIRQHIDGLCKKNYPKYAKALDFVLMFVPIEPAFLEAVKTDAQLWKFAYDRKILLVSPTNLMAVLKIIADLWKVEHQNQHALLIAEKAGALYDKFAGFIDNMETVGKKLEDASNSYDTAFKQLSTGRGNIVNRVEELKKMGATAHKSLPSTLLGKAAEHNDD